MKVVDFYTLPRAIQDRFVGSVMSGFPPAPMVAQKGGKPTKLIWLAVAALAFVLLVIAARLGYGSLESSLSLHSGRAVVLYFGLVFGITFGLVQAFAHLVRERALPYAAGVYLFPACIIDARSEKFRVYSTQDLTGVAAQGSAVRVAFPSGIEFVFPTADAKAAAQLVSDVQAGRDRSLRAKAAEDAKELVAVDPLHNPRFSSPVGPRDAYTVRRPPWGKFGWLVAVVLSAIFGPTLWALRNSGSDKKMYARATQANDSPAYRAYMTHGEKFKEEVGGTLLPRSELRDAERDGTVEALLDFKKRNPQTNIGPEVALSIRTAMLAELEKAKAGGTLGALDAFAKAYPEHGVGPELRAAIHAVYVRELDAYKKRAPTKDKNVIPFVERLFAWAEKNGPNVEVRFRRKSSTSLGRADTVVGKMPSFMGEVSYPSRYFDEKHSLPREERLAKALAAELDRGFSPELFEVTVGASVPEGDLPEPKVPTLYVTHNEEWSGHNVSTQKPRGTFVGVIFNFDAAFALPGDATPFRFKNDILKFAPTAVLKEDDPALPPGKAEEKLYDAMSNDAFDVFAKRLLALMFKD